MGEPFCKRDSGSNTGVLTLPVSDNLQFSDDLWAICPTVHSALFMMIKAAGINITMISNSSCQSHERYIQHLDNLKRYKMKLIIEMPPDDQKHPSGNMRKQFNRWMTFASVAREVYVIGPRSNPYWTQWGTFFAENDYTTSVHHWCGLGVKDSDSGQSLARYTRISSSNFLRSTVCSCHEPHIHKLRVERRLDEIQRGESAPHQIALQQWASSITKMLRLKKWSLGDL